MTIAFLYYVEDYAGLNNSRVYADQVVGAMFGYQQVIINAQHDGRPNNGFPMTFRTLEEAEADPALSSLQWVYLHPRADDTLQAFTHPADNVIYCIGSNMTGFSRDVAELAQTGTTLRVHSPIHEHRVEFHAANILTCAVWDRVLKGG